jgi:homoserine dehydrogenase
VGVNNAVFLVGDKIGMQMFYGRGAGGDATGAAVVSDLIEIARNLAAGQVSVKKISRLLDSYDLEISETPRPVSWYMRVTVTDQRRIVARVAEVIAHHDINIDSSGAGHHRRARFLAYDSGRGRCDQRFRVYGRTRSVTARR